MKCCLKTENSATGADIDRTPSQPRPNPDSLARTIACERLSTSSLSNFVAGAHEVRGVFGAGRDALHFVEAAVLFGRAAGDEPGREEQAEGGVVLAPTQLRQVARGLGFVTRSLSVRLVKA